jgi:hypothetical protein
MKAGVQIAGDSRNNLVQHNLLQAGSEGAIICEESHGVVLNNTIMA